LSGTYFIDVAQSFVKVEDENDTGNAQKDVQDFGKEDNTNISDSEDLHDARENLRQEAIKMVDIDKKYSDTKLNNITKNESAADDRIQENSGKVEMTSTGTGRFSR
jgi:hypothetical protein